MIGPERCDVNRPENPGVRGERQKSPSQPGRGSIHNIRDYDIPDFAADISYEAED
jgi:hypothetical protein